MDLTVDPGRPEGPSKQLVDAVLDAVATGSLRPGDRLPSVREAAVEALVNANTVAKAWRELAQLEVVFSKSGSGVFVAASGPDRARALRGGATLRALGSALDQARSAGHSPEALLAHVREHLGLAIPKEEIPS